MKVVLHCILVLFCAVTVSHATPEDSRLLDGFDRLQGWEVVLGAAGAQATLTLAPGREGKSMRLDFRFPDSSGYIIVRKQFNLDLPENYAFSFDLRGTTSIRQVEFKLVDDTSQNVWWRKRTEFRFPTDWQQFKIKRQRLEYAWGAHPERALRHVDSIELAITAAHGESGTIWLDDLRFSPRPPPPDLHAEAIVVEGSSALWGHPAEWILDAQPETAWRSAPGPERQWVILDFGRVWDFGGLVIDWEAQRHAVDYDVYGADDKQRWSLLRRVTGGNGGRDYIPVEDGEFRYLKLELRRSAEQRGYGIKSIDIRPFEFTLTPNRFFAAMARDYPRGWLARYWNGEQTYWTVSGTNPTERESLLNTDGMVEIDAGGVSIEPFLYVDGKLLTWADVVTEPALEEGDLPIPSVTWRAGDLSLTVTVVSAGEGAQSALYLRYRVINHGARKLQPKLFVAVRPQQVLPPWQDLLITGGVSAIRELHQQDDLVWVNDDSVSRDNGRDARVIAALTRPARFGAVNFDAGPLPEFLRRGVVPRATRAVDNPSYSTGMFQYLGLASGALEYPLSIEAGAYADVYLAAPYFDPQPWLRANFTSTGRYRGNAAEEFNGVFATVKSAWREKLGRPGVFLPMVAQRYTQTLRSNLAYIFINRDGMAFHPGSRTYARAWIRDGALTSAALLGMGYADDVREFISWYAQYQYDDGKIPCCIDQNGPDAVAEHDSPGQFLFLIAEYYRYTRDVEFVRHLWPRIVNVVEYAKRLRDSQQQAEFRLPEHLGFWGLMPESISHEGYSSRPVHAYWDDFWMLRGFKDAVQLADAVGDVAAVGHFSMLRDTFHQDLLDSLKFSIARLQLSYLPASVELGDFDPSSMAIAVVPGAGFDTLPQPYATHTFETYYREFQQRRDGQREWDNYAPYEIRLAGVFAYLGWRERAHELLQFLFAGQRPAAWNQWAEVVWREPGTPRFIGDMPHSWVGAEFVRVLRNFLLYEEEQDHSLVLGSGIPADWVESAEGVRIEQLPTYYGPISYHLRRSAPDEWHWQITPAFQNPPNKLVLAPPLPRQPHEVMVNGHPTGLVAGRIEVPPTAAEVVIRF